MPNWVLNGVELKGSPEDIEKVKSQLGQGFTRDVNLGRANSNQSTSVISYSNPVFSFWNIVNPLTDNSLPTKGVTRQTTLSSNGQASWYEDAWGTDGDVAVLDGEEFPTTRLNSETDTTLSYQFDTAWTDCREAIGALAIQNPTIEIVYDFEYTNDGKGGSVAFLGAQMTILEEYLWKCSQCDYLEKNQTTAKCPNCGEENENF